MYKIKNTDRGGLSISTPTTSKTLGFEAAVKARQTLTRRQLDKLQQHGFLILKGLPPEWPIGSPTLTID